MESLTQFGNPVLLIALAVIVGARLLLARRGVAAAYWFAAIALLIVVTVLSKIYLAACHDPKFALQSPSGHVGFSVLVYGGLGVIIGVGRPVWLNWVLGSLIALWVFVIAVSRVLLHLHTMTDVFVGATIGLSALWLFAFAYVKLRPEPFRLTWLDLAALLAILLLMHSYRDGVEWMLITFARSHRHWISCF